MAAWLFLLACSPGDHARGGGEPWTAPTWEGDGLPPSEDTAHPRSSFNDPDTGGDTAETASLSITHALFAHQSGASGTSGSLYLLTAELGCADAFSAGGFFDGVYMELRPQLAEDTGAEDGEEARWEGRYTSCGSSPCLEYALWIDGQDFGYLSGEVWLEVLSYDAHYLQVSWASEETSGEGLELYNCGSQGMW